MSYVTLRERLKKRGALVLALTSVVMLGWLALTGGPGVASRKSADVAVDVSAPERVSMSPTDDVVRTRRHARQAQAQGAAELGAAQSRVVDCISLSDAHSGAILHIASCTMWRDGEPIVECQLAGLAQCFDEHEPDYVVVRCSHYGPALLTRTFLAAHCESPRVMGLWPLQLVRLSLDDSLTARGCSCEVTVRHRSESSDRLTTTHDSNVDSLVLRLGAGEVLSAAEMGAIVSAAELSGGALVARSMERRTARLEPWQRCAVEIPCVPVGAQLQLKVVAPEGPDLQYWVHPLGHHKFTFSASNGGLSEYTLDWSQGAEGVVDVIVLERPHGRVIGRATAPGVGRVSLEVNSPHDVRRVIDLGLSDDGRFDISDLCEGRYRVVASFVDPEQRVLNVMQGDWFSIDGQLYDAGTLLSPSSPSANVLVDVRKPTNVSVASDLLSRVVEQTGWTAHLCLMRSDGTEQLIELQGFGEGQYTLNGLSDLDQLRFVVASSSSQLLSADHETFITVDPQDADLVPLPRGRDGLRSWRLSLAVREQRAVRVRFDRVVPNELEGRRVRIQVSQLGASASEYESTVTLVAGMNEALSRLLLSHGDWRVTALEELGPGIFAPGFDQAGQKQWLDSYCGTATFSVDATNEGLDVHVPLVRACIAKLDLSEFLEAEGPDTALLEAVAGIDVVGGGAELAAGRVLWDETARVLWCLGLIPDTQYHIRSLDIMFRSGASEQVVEVRPGRR